MIVNAVLFARGTMHPLVRYADSPPWKRGRLLAGRGGLDVLRTDGAAFLNAA